MTCKKILIVDDDKDLLHGMNVWLRSLGYKVVFAVDATSAIAMAQSEKPDLIILDISLPAGGGYHVMKSLKSARVSNKYKKRFYNLKPRCSKRSSRWRRMLSKSVICMRAAPKHKKIIVKFSTMRS